MTPQVITNRVSLAFGKEDCATIEQVAAEFDLSTMRVRQLLAEGLKKKVIQRISIKEGVRVLYPQPMIEQLKKFYKSKGGAISRPKTSPVEKTAEVLFKVPVFDAEAKAILLQRFGTEQKIVDFLKEKLAETYNPVKADLQAIEKEYLEKKAAAILAIPA